MWQQGISGDALFKAVQATRVGESQLMCALALVETMPGSQGRVSSFHDKIGCASSDC